MTILWCVVITYDKVGDVWSEVIFVYASKFVDFVGYASLFKRESVKACHGGECTRSGNY